MGVAVILATASASADTLLLFRYDQGDFRLILDCLSLVRISDDGFANKIMVRLTADVPLLL